MTQQDAERESGALCILHFASVDGRRIVRWSLIGDGAYYTHPDMLSYDAANGKITISKYALIQIFVKVNYDFVCPPASSIEENTRQVCLTRESPTLGSCNAKMCCNGSRMLDKFPIKCSANNTRTVGSVVLMAIRRVRSGDSLFVVTDLPSSGIAAAFISIVKI